MVSYDLAFFSVTLVIPYGLYVLLGRQGTAMYTKRA